MQSRTIGQNNEAMDGTGDDCGDPRNRYPRPCGTRRGADAGHRGPGSRIIVGALVLAALTVGAFSVGEAVEQREAHAENKWLCAGYIGWGFVSVGATAVADTFWVAVVGITDTGLTAYSANEACGWGTANQHLGYKKLCHDQHFLYRSPISGKLVYDSRDGVCKHNPYELDNFFCKYLHPSGYEGLCFAQALRDYQDYVGLLKGSYRWIWGTPYESDL